ncbi:sensor N-terminal transmembrane domain-containing protein [Pseudooceanicola sp. LIPI14-2-Ac024]|uniref:sensor N-terminal transmembrane domain-containing protein n=1 Tax=Pseudooceanicola sp. LIPI14-2-Ac024 TaxID=3344875 RepID=UPI0035D0D8E5
MALVEGINLADERSEKTADVVLGDDFVAPHAVLEDEQRARRERRGVFSLKQSPLTRKIIVFNLIALNVLVAGILYLNASRDSLVQQRARALASEAELVADVFEVQAASGSDAVARTLAGLDLRQGVELYLFDGEGTLTGKATGSGFAGATATEARQAPTIITDFLNALWSGATTVFSSGRRVTEPEPLRDQVEAMVAAHPDGGVPVRTGRSEAGSFFAVTSPVQVDGQRVGTVALVSSAGEIDAMVRAERERVLQMFVIATLVSIGLSLVLASTIANPLSDLAAAAEVGRDRDPKRMSPSRVRIPDLTARPDEIGRLSGALRGMVSALYDRIDANEQFAADVAHEIKNPLASLRSAVGSLRFVKKDEQRAKLLDVIEHDVRRLDRLVSDISNASRLDSELVKEEEEEFDLLTMLGNLNEYLGQQAGEKGIDFISDLPKNQIVMRGLEARLAQVFVNLITNAISFCEEGDAIRVWARRRENRVLIVVEDTGPGIPDQSLTKIFKRFYSHRPETDFGNNSGLGLAISKQIVEAHGGVIWAENIRPTDADITSEPLGARFVVGLPV